MMHGQTKIKLDEPFSEWDSCYVRSNPCCQTLFHFQNNGIEVHQT